MTESKKPLNIKPVYVHIMTAGRTGSTYIVNLLKASYPEARIIAEKEPGRILKIILDAGMLGLPYISDCARPLARKWYVTSRRKFCARAMGYTHLIEINPFLVNLGSDLNAIENGPSIHIVRHPVSWVKSAVGFGSYSWRRPLIPYIPLVRERPLLGHPQWRQWDEVQRFAWRWKFRNGKIDSFSAMRPRDLHLVIKYEDMFSDNGPIIDEFRKMVVHLGLDPDLLRIQQLQNAVVNRTLRENQFELSDEECSSILEICGDLAEAYGYSTS